MTEYLAPRRGEVDRTLQGRMVLDAAEGILVGLRGCDFDAAFLELARAAKCHKLAVLTIAAALIELATGAGRSGAVGPAAVSVLSANGVPCSRKPATSPHPGIRHLRLLDSLRLAATTAAV